MIEIPGIAEVLKIIIEEGLESFGGKKQRRNVRVCVRDQVRRELVFNREVLQELLRQSQEGDNPRWDGEQRRRLIRAIRTAAFDALDAYLIPLEVFFDDQLTEQAHSRVFGFAGDHQRPAHYGRVKEVKTQLQLLERTYRRLHFYKLYEEAQERTPNLEYLHYLVISSLRSFEDPLLSAARDQGA